MSRKIAFSCVCIALSSLAIGQTCPSIKDLHANKLKGWKAYDIYGTKLNEKQSQKFRARAQEFALAEVIPYSTDGLAIRCLYRDKTGSNLEAYLAKNDIVADNTKDYWYEVSGSKHCAAGVKLCEFNPHALQNKQLADNN